MGQSTSERTTTMPLGVVVERREVDHPWAEESWRPVAVIPGAGPIDTWRPLDEGPGFARFHAATLPLELHRKETEAYRAGLTNEPPSVFVVMAADDDPASPWPWRVQLVTASAFDAQDYLDSGELIVEAVAMPEGLVAWVRDWVERHHVDQPFKKRKRSPQAPDPFGYGRAPVEIRRKKRGRCG